MLSVGEILKKTREKKGLTLDKVEKQLRIREKFLKAIESDNWSFFNSKIYIEGIIKNYSKILDLDSNKMTAFFRREYEVRDEVKFKRRVSSSYLTPETKKIAFLGLFLVIFLFLLYFGYQVKLYLSPPSLSIIEPKNAMFKRIDKIKIVGKTDKEAAITIFGERIYTDKEGFFSYSFPLRPGKNELMIELVGANGKKTIIKKEFIRKD